MNTTDRVEETAKVETPPVVDNVIDIPVHPISDGADAALTFVKQNPVLAIVGGIAAGMLIATLLPRRPRSRLGKQGARLGDAVASTASLVTKRALERADATGESLKRGSRIAARRSEDLSDQAAKGIASFLTTLFSHASDLSEDAADAAERFGKRAADRLADAGGVAEDKAASAGRRISKAAADVRSKIIG